MDTVFLHSLISQSNFSLFQTSQVPTPTDLRSPPGAGAQVLKTPYEKAWLVKKWYNFDLRYPLNLGKGIQSYIRWLCYFWIYDYFPVLC